MGASDVGWDQFMTTTSHPEEMPLTRPSATAG